MTVGVFPLQKEWTRQPPAGTPLRKNHWSTNGLILAVGGDNYNDLAVIGGAPVTNTVTKTARGLDQNGTEVLAYERPIGLNEGLGTVVMDFEETASGKNANAKLWITTDSDMQALRTLGGDSFIDITINNISAAMNTTVDLWDLSRHTLSMWWDAANNSRRVKADSASVIESTTAFTAPSGDTTNWHWLNRADGARNTNGKARYLLLYNLIKSVAETDALHSNPFLIWEPETLLIPTGIAAVGPVIDDVNLTDIVLDKSTGNEINGSGLDVVTAVVLIDENATEISATNLVAIAAKVTFDVDVNQMIPGDLKFGIVSSLRITFP